MATTTPGAFYKQPAEQHEVTVEFSGKLPTGRSLASGTVSAVEVTSGASMSSTVLCSTTLTISGTQATATVKAGTALLDYEIRFLVTLDNGDILQEDVVMRVRDL